MTEIHDNDAAEARAAREAEAPEHYWDRPETFTEPNDDERADYEGTPPYDPRLDEPTAEDMAPPPPDVPFDPSDAWDLGAFMVALFAAGATSVSLRTVSFDGEVVVSADRMVSTGDPEAPYAILWGQRGYGLTIAAAAEACLDAVRASLEVSA